MNNQQTKLTRNQKNSYRCLLYYAMLNIRMICPSSGSQSRNPLKWRKQYRQSQVAGALADWLHNLARYSSSNFSGFDEEYFWGEYDRLSKRLLQAGFNNTFNYRDVFETIQEELSEQK